MNNKTIIISIIAVSLLTLVSFSNVVGYNTVKTSHEELIESKYSFDECKDYLFQTIVEISENPEIKDIIKSNYKPQRTILPFRRNNADLKVEHLELLYKIGLKIMDRLGEEQVKDLMENLESEKPEFADDLESVVMGNDELRERIYTLNKMNSGELYTTDFEDTPIICLIAVVLLLFGACLTLPLDLIGAILKEIHIIFYYLFILILLPILIPFTIFLGNLFDIVFDCFPIYGPWFPMR